MNSQVMIGGGLAVIRQVNRATDPSVTTVDVGWITNGEIPGGEGTLQMGEGTAY